MKETINFLKLCKYSFRYKTNLFFLFLFFGIGVMNELVTKGTEFLGAFYIVLCSIYLFQFIMSLAMSEMIQSSGISHRIHVDIPVKLNVTMSLILYTLVIIFRIAMANMYPEKANDIASSLFIIDILFFVLFIYTAFVYKYFLVSIVLFCFVAPFIMSGYNIVFRLMGSQISLKVAVLSGYAAIALGALSQYLICLALAKKPIAQRAFRGIFRQAK